MNDVPVCDYCGWNLEWTSGGWSDGMDHSPLVCPDSPIGSPGHEPRVIEQSQVVLV